MFSALPGTSTLAFPRYRITKSQSIVGLCAILVLIALGISSILESRTTEEQSRILSNIETPAASIIFTQRETLVYTTKLALWSNGGTTRREVQIARNILAQRLAVVDSSGKTMGQRANSSYWNSLRDADAIVASAPAGVLPESLHNAMNSSIKPVIDRILLQARNLVVSYQKSIDQEMINLAHETAKRDSLNLLLLYIFIALGAIFIILNARSNFKNYRLAQASIAQEADRLEAAQLKVAQLQDLDVAKNALISNVNHELRTPLTSIIGYIELMQRDTTVKADPQIQQYLEVIERNSEVLLKLVESLLSLSKFDSAVGELPDKSVSLNQVIDNAIFTMQPAAAKKEISLQIKANDDLTIRGDVGQLSQVFINLLSNAIKFSTPQSKIEIKLHNLNAAIGEVIVRDYGIGIPEPDLAHIFTRFFRASNVGTSQFEGTGLGLSIVQQVVEHHHGSIEVKSTLAAGTTFRLQFPLIPQGVSHE